MEFIAVKAFSVKSIGKPDRIIRGEPGKPVVLEFLKDELALKKDGVIMDVDEWTEKYNPPKRTPPPTPSINQVNKAAAIAKPRVQPQSQPQAQAQPQKSGKR